ncbi:MAG: TolC family protein [Planctomycetaceae bacterium]|nr:TolC family protein [Planctomycetaceae bacterium]
MNIKQKTKDELLISRVGLLIKILAIIIITFLFYLSGCSRQYYRQKADGEVSSLIKSAGRDKRWEAVDYSIQPNPQSRFYDPHNPDCEPMPPDDATAHRLMQCVNGKRNGDWGSRGKTNFVENPNWQRYLTMNEDGLLVLDKEAAFRLAQIHSPAYQTALENLYLSALAVSFQRFQFDTQFYGGSSLFYSTNGALRDSTWKEQNVIGFNKKMATGAQAMIEVANNITWQLAGPDTQSYNTIISASFLQPFLRGGGREYVLENLTRSERDLLANIRQMAFYRQGFYKTVIFGGNDVGLPVAGGMPASRSTGSSTGGGYISLLASQVRIANQKSNVISSRASERQIEALFTAGRVDYYQVEQMRLNYLDSQSQLMSQSNTYNTTVEQFVNTKIGLPPSTTVEVKDPLLNQFELMSPGLTAIQEEIEKLFVPVRDKEKAVPADLENNLYELCDRLKGEIAIVYEDISKLEQKIPERLENIRSLAGETEKFEGYIDPKSFSEDVFQARVTQIRTQMPKIEIALNAISKQIAILRKSDRAVVTEMLRKGELDAESMACMKMLEMGAVLEATKARRSSENEENMTVLSDAQKDPYRYFISQLLTRLTGQTRYLSVNQARARLDAVTMTQIDITPETALKVAAQHRLDWMNARTELVNKWRNIEITANQLQGNLNVSVNGDIGTRTNNPVAFDSRNAGLSVGVQWDAPLTRLAERNAYRQAQIEYQRARRDYYSYVDDVNQTLRNSLRDVSNVQFDFELRRRSVLVALSKVVLAQLNMERPAEIGATSESMSSNLARDLVEALNNLLSAQNSFMESWVQHYTLRAALSLDLGVMQLDENGVWLDPGSIRESDYVNMAGINAATGNIRDNHSRTPQESLNNVMPPAPNPFTQTPFTPTRLPQPQYDSSENEAEQNDPVYPKELQKKPRVPQPELLQEDDDSSMPVTQISGFSGQQSLISQPKLSQRHLSQQNLPGQQVPQQQITETQIAAAKLRAPEPRTIFPLQQRNAPRTPAFLLSQSLYERTKTSMNAEGMQNMFEASQQSASNRQSANVNDSFLRSDACDLPEPVIQKNAKTVIRKTVAPRSLTEPPQLTEPRQLIVPQQSVVQTEETPQSYLLKSDENVRPVSIQSEDEGCDETSHRTPSPEAVQKRPAVVAIPARIKTTSNSTQPAMYLGAGSTMKRIETN